MDIKNILNKDGSASQQKSGSDSGKSSSEPGSPKSTASAPPLAAPETSTTEVPAPRVQPPTTAPRRGSFVPPPSPTSRDFVCLTCQKTFARRSDLVRHGALPVIDILTISRTNTFWITVRFVMELSDFV